MSFRWMVRFFYIYFIFIFVTRCSRLCSSDLCTLLTVTCCFPTAISNSRGEFLLNGVFVVSMFKKEVKVGNVVIEYSGSENVVERINCTERIEEEIVVQVRMETWGRNSFVLKIKGIFNIFNQFLEHHDSKSRYLLFVTSLVCLINKLEKYYMYKNVF